MKFMGMGVLTLNHVFCRMEEFLLVMPKSAVAVRTPLLLMQPLLFNSVNMYSAGEVVQYISYRKSTVPPLSIV